MTIRALVAAAASAVVLGLTAGTAQAGLPVWELNATYATDAACQKSGQFYVDNTEANAYLCTDTHDLWLRYGGEV